MNGTVLACDLKVALAAVTSLHTQLSDKNEQSDHISGQRYSLISGALPRRVGVCPLLLAKPFWITSSARRDRGNAPNTLKSFLLAYVLHAPNNTTSSHYSCNASGMQLCQRIKAGSFWLTHYNIDAVVALLPMLVVDCTTPVPKKRVTYCCAGCSGPKAVCLLK